MDTSILNLEGKEVVVVDKQVFLDLVYQTAADMRESKRKKICNLREALEIMGCGKTKFYQMLNDPKCLIRKSSVNGRYQVESLDRELNRQSKLR
ncbi:hypothetical protein [Aquimarina algiphila]|uniref:hypothetical protein n=1 Tax=Aquimarina algiphila TaxID=2047982 RepID=UPI00232C6261|nr:hypothetical protein [Aquimarina algiphila]